MFATAPVKTIVPTSAILELYGTYRSQFKIRKNEVSGAAVVFLPTPLLLFIQTVRRWKEVSFSLFVGKKYFRVELRKRFLSLFRCCYARELEKRSQ